ncbi:hypothetical protein LTR27_007968 [Elasticomyces elasticus]|nr:hypothetical protein LTR27_007968 [Elasticomyces elasticus]
MQTYAEATSLSHLNTIASNPPSHPTQRIKNCPTSPLVLYIARVPGSRDVFLTPQKPREKVVTAHDVQGCLYYVHVNAREDDEAILEPMQQRPTSADSNASSSHLFKVERKPVTKPSPPLPLPVTTKTPVSPPYPTEERMPGFAGGPVQQTSWIARRKPISSLIEKPPPVPSHIDLPEIPPRPSPTPPAEEPSLHDDNIRLLRRADTADENNPYFLRPHLSQTPSPGPTNQQSSTTDTGLGVGSLTLIRRDAVSSEQWNVATIHDPHILEVSSTTLLSPGLSAKRTKRGGAPIYLDLTNPGYAQFIETGERPESRVSTSTRSSEDSCDEGGVVPEGVFRRRLYMPGSRFGEHGYGGGLGGQGGRVGHVERIGHVGHGGHRVSASLSSPGNGESLGRRSGGILRHSVDFGGSSNGGAGAGGDRGGSGSGGSRSAYDGRKCYTFTSPWDGRCEFATGVTGKSLKCWHTLPSHKGGSVTQVSELRFNLPTPFKSSSKTEGEGKRSSYFSRHARQLSTDGDGSGDGDGGVVVLKEDGRRDLELGREKAGGGFGGKQAKLGKLIVEVEGVRMLDLVVAANVGLWWRAYGRGS